MRLINMNFVKKNKQCVKQEIHSSSLKIETAGLSEKLINFYQNTRRGIPVNSRHRSDCSENGSITDSKHSHSGIIWWHGQENFSSGAHPAFLSRVRGSFPGLKRPGREVDLSPLLQKLRDSGAIPLFPVCSFLKCTETTLDLFRKP